MSCKKKIKLRSRISISLDKKMYTPICYREIDERKTHLIQSTLWRLSIEWVHLSMFEQWIRHRIAHLCDSELLFSSFHVCRTCLLFVFVWKSHVYPLRSTDITNTKRKKNTQMLEKQHQVKLNRMKTKSRVRQFTFIYSNSSRLRANELVQRTSELVFFPKHFNFAHSNQQSNSCGLKFNRTANSFGARAFSIEYILAFISITWIILNYALQRQITLYERSRAQSFFLCIPIKWINNGRETRNELAQHEFNDETQINCPADGIFALIPFTRAGTSNLHLHCFRLENAQSNPHFFCWCRSFFDHDILRERSTACFECESLYKKESAGEQVL